VERVSEALEARLAVRAEEDLATAAHGAGFVILSISTGLDTMAGDLLFAQRHGFSMPVGDTSGLRDPPVVARRPSQGHRAPVIVTRTPGGHAPVVPGPVHANDGPRCSRR